MLTLFVLVQTASAHSGGLDAHGCHAGSQPYHCHRGTRAQRAERPRGVSGPSSIPGSGRRDEQATLIHLRGQGGVCSYVVGRGDTLGEIALAYGTTVGQLAELNNLEDPNQIEVGTSLKVRICGQKSTGRTSAKVATRQGCGGESGLCGFLCFIFVFSIPMAVVLRLLLAVGSGVLQSWRVPSSSQVGVRPSSDQIVGVVTVIFNVLAGAVMLVLLVPLGIVVFLVSMMVFLGGLLLGLLS
ncbi:MAG: LysM peptidoglycan-binding domain-containing protein [Myxococcota bacterium]